MSNSLRQRVEEVSAQDTPCNDPSLAAFWNCLRVVLSVADQLIKADRAVSQFEQARAQFRESLSIQMDE